MPLEHRGEHFIHVGELEVSCPWRPFTLNEERRWSRFARAERVKEWRDWFVIAGRQLRTKTSFDLPARLVTIDVVPRLAGGSDQDPGGCFPAAKAAIDGLDDAGVLSGDGPSSVVWQRFWSPQRDGTDGLDVRLGIFREMTPRDTI